MTIAASQTRDAEGKSTARSPDRCDEFELRQCLMNPPIINHSAALPPELFLQILAGFTFEELLPVLGVLMMPIPDIFIPFPALSHLEFVHPVCIRDTKYLQQEYWKPIQRLTWNSSRGLCWPVFPSAFVVDIPHVDTRRPTPLELHIVVGHVLAPIGSFAPPDGGERVREVLDCWEDWSSESDALGLRAALTGSFAGAIQFLEVALSCLARFAAILPPLNLLQAFTLLLDCDDELPAGASTGVFHCPLLERVELSAPTQCRWLPADDVAAFIRSALRAPEPQLPLLVLMNVHVSGSSEYLLGRFSKICASEDPSYCQYDI
ncbi:hypothetical protein AURDEDRAFT_124082 [Auricularia subglabra TFB-10046 SS5]|nr:hypothetical protein AURDEDRAFT_124082 [Auricularia subglabra TFB-10046 SS5]